MIHAETSISKCLSRSRDVSLSIPIPNSCGGDIKGGVGLCWLGGVHYGSGTEPLGTGHLFSGHDWNVSPSSSVATLYIWPVSVWIAGSVVWVETCCQDISGCAHEQQSSAACECLYFSVAGGAC
jgi:hypothetical protein